MRGVTTSVAWNLATVTDSEGGATRYKYDSTNRMTRLTGAKGSFILPFALF